MLLTRGRMGFGQPRERDKLEERPLGLKSHGTQRFLDYPSNLLLTGIKDFWTHMKHRRARVAGGYGLGAFDDHTRQSKTWRT